MKTCMIVWGNWGPYHYSRFEGFKKAFEEEGVKAVGLELFPKSGYYEWNKVSENNDEIIHLNLGNLESAYPLGKLLTQVYPLIRKIKPSVIFLPSYWHWSVTINCFARLTGTKVVMMNETHGGTDRARGFKRWIKKQIVSRFHGALIGGIPHRKYFNELGIPDDKIFSGYDAIDNEYFATKANEISLNKEAFREKLNLPKRYFLSLSRMIEKKNLPRLVDAYTALCTQYPDAYIDLLFVGSGEEEETVRAQVLKNKLNLIDHTLEQPAQFDEGVPNVHFLGFRQVDENPAFFALSECFVMPSVFEEWGLVANEAMACGRPVISSAEAGCAKDLILEGETGFTFPQNSTDALTKTMARFIEDPTLADRLGKNAFNHIQQFGCDNFGNQSLACAKACLTN